MFKKLLKKLQGLFPSQDETMPAPVYQMLPGETLRQFMDRIYAAFPDDKKQPAIEMLRREIPVETQDEIRRAILEDPEDWATPYHLFWGMSIRNLLRSQDFGEDYWPIWNLDDIYVQLVEEAVLTPEE